MEHFLPDLPYNKNALEPYISAETFEYHHGKHHKAYVMKLNELTRGNEYENLPLEEIIRVAEGPLFDNAAQHLNHSFFWNCLRVAGGGSPNGNIGDEIQKAFGSFDKFKEEFNQKAVSNFGSGWTWLVSDSEGKLSILNTANADTPLTHDKKALLTVDVWEHAYYIDYRNSRSNYLKAFWNVVNWDFVNQNLQDEMTFKGFGNKGHADQHAQKH